MTLEEFVKVFENELEVEGINAQTHFRELDEWSSLMGLSVISAVDDEFDIILTGADLRKSTTIEDVYNIAKEK